MARLHSESLVELNIQGDTALVDLWYPRNATVKFIEVGLVDVRAADSIRISYDFDRDGYKIEQASRFEWAADSDDSDDAAYDPCWQEVAFVRAWASERKVTATVPVANERSVSASAQRETDVRREGREVSDNGTGD